MDEQRRAEFRDEVEKAAEAKGWSQARLAKEAEISQTTMTKVFRAESVAPETMRKIREALGMNYAPVIYDPDTYDLRTQVTLEMIGQWLQAIDDPSERDAAGRYLVRCMARHAGSVTGR